MINVLLVTTTIYDDSSDSNLQRLFDSIIKKNGVNVRHIVLFQGVNKECVNTLLPNNVVPMYSPEVMSLSRARNIMLHSVRGDIENFHVVAFPDDDCWYPYENFNHIVNFICENGIDYMVTKYRFSGHRDLGKYFCVYESASLLRSLEFSSSITIFVTGKVFSKVLEFDENLGVGAEFVGGEDLDYSVKAFFNSKRRAFVDEFLIAHKDRNILNKIRYYEGSLYVFKKNRGLSYLIKYLFLRKVLVGLYYVLKGKMKISDYMKKVSRVLKSA